MVRQTPEIVSTADGAAQRSARAIAHSSVCAVPAATSATP